MRPCGSGWRFFSACFFLFAAFSSATLAQNARRAAVYAGSYTSTLNSLLIEPTPGSATLWARSLNVQAPEGNDFTADFRVANNAGASTLYRLRGSFGCANGLLEVSLDSFVGSGTSQCQQLEGNGAPGLCGYYLPQRCTGVFPYSTYATLDGAYELLIAGWCGIQGDVVLTCDGTCSGVVQCSSSLQQTVVQGGTVVMDGGVIIADAGNNTFYTNTTEITIELSRNVTIQSSAPEITINLTNSTTVVQSQANTTYLNTGPVRTCTDWLSYTGLTGTNRTVTDTAVPLVFSIVDPVTGDGASAWVGGTSTVEYVGTLRGASYEFVYCLQSAEVFISATAEERLYVQLVNVSTGTPLAPSIATSVHARNLNGTQGMLTSACGSFITDEVRTGDEYAFYVYAEGLGGAPASLVLAPAAAFSLAIAPTGCQGVLNNITFNITLQFANGTLIKPGYYISISTDTSDGAFTINNLGVVEVSPNTTGTYPARCLYATKDSDGVANLHYSGVCALSANGGTPRGGSLSLLSSATVTFSDLGNGSFSANTTDLAFSGEKCVALSRSGAQVTAAFSGVCSVATTGPSAACLVTGKNAAGNATFDFSGVCGFQDSSTVTFTPVSGGVYTAAVRFPAGQNLSRCVTCDETTGELEAPNGIETPTISSPNGTVKVNGDLESNKECSTSQCNSKADPPSSSPTVLIIRRICFGCGDGSNGNGDNDDGSSSDGPDGGIIPFIPFFPFLPFVPFFPPFVPFFPIAGSMTGGSGVVPASGPPGAPPSPVPFVTILINATAPLTIGGLYIPYVNFTEDIVYCGVETRGLTVIDESSLPHTLYICEATINGTYAWVPYCGCSSYSSNYGETFQNTSHVYTQGSTLFISNSSQLWVEGNTYLAGETYIRNLTITQELSVCNSTAKMNSIESCAGGAVDFPAGITIAGVPITPGTNGSISFCTPTPSPLSVNSITSCDGIAPVDMPSGVQTTVLRTNIINSTDPLTISAPSVAIIAPSGVAMDRLNVQDVYAGAIYQLDDIGLPVPFPEGITVDNTATFTGSVGVCDQPLRVNTVSSCDGTSKVNFPTGINTSTVVTAELQAPPSGTIVISGSNVTLSGPVSAPDGVSTTTLTAVTATITNQVVNNQNVLNQTVTTQNVQDITVVNTPVFGGTAFYYTAAASYSGDLTFCVSWDADTPTYTGCSSPSTPAAATVNVQLQRVGNMVYGTMNRTDAELGQLLFSTGTANSCTLFAPVGVIVGADFRPRAGTIAAGTEAQPFLLENQGTTNAGCFCSLVPYVTDQGLLFFRPRQLTGTLAHQCCTLSDTAGTFKSSTAFAIAARGTYSGLLAGNTFTAGLDDLYTFSYILPL